MPFHLSVHHRSGGWNRSSHLCLFTQLSELPWAMVLLTLGDEISSFSLKQERSEVIRVRGGFAIDDKGWLAVRVDVQGGNTKTLRRGTIYSNSRINQSRKDKLCTSSLCEDRKIW